MFAWEPSQMPEIPREVIEHNLRIYPDATPLRQRPRKKFVERQNFIREEVRKLLHAGFIEEVHHPEWLANLVVIPKANGKLRMCINFTPASTRHVPETPISSTYRSDCGLHLWV